MPRNVENRSTRIYTGRKGFCVEKSTALQNNSKVLLWVLPKRGYPKEMKPKERKQGDGYQQTEKVNDSVDWSSSNEYEQSLVFCLLVYVHQVTSDIHCQVSKLRILDAISHRCWSMTPKGPRESKVFSTKSE